MTLQPTIFADTTSGPTVWIRVEGKGTFQNSGGLKEFSKTLIADGRRDFVVDLENCPAMDSTFMGTLAGLALRLREAGGGRLWVKNCNERNEDLLAGLGLDALFSADPLPCGECKDHGAVMGSADKAAMREVMRNRPAWLVVLM